MIVKFEMPLYKGEKVCKDHGAALRFASKLLKEFKELKKTEDKLLYPIDEAKLKVTFIH